MISPRQGVLASPDARSIVQHDAVIAGLSLLGDICKNPRSDSLEIAALSHYCISRMQALT